jgi:hypothetical protein
MSTIVASTLLRHAGLETSQQPFSVSPPGWSDSAKVVPQEMFKAIKTLLH